MIFVSSSPLSSGLLAIRTAGRAVRIEELLDLTTKQLTTIATTITTELRSRSATIRRMLKRTRTFGI